MQSWCRQWRCYAGYNPSEFQPCWLVVWSYLSHNSCLAFHWKSKSEAFFHVQQQIQLGCLYSCCHQSSALLSSPLFLLANMCTKEGCWRYTAIFYSLFKSYFIDSYFIVICQMLSIDACGVDAGGKAGKVTKCSPCPAGRFWWALFY